MTELTLDYYQTYNRRVRLSLYVAGLFRHPQMPLYVYRFILFSIICSNIYLYVAILRYCLANISDFHRLCPGMNMLFSSSTAFVKVVCLFLKRKGLKKLDETLKYLFDAELKDESRRPQLLSMLPLFQKTAFVYCICVFWTCISFYILALRVVVSEIFNSVGPKKCTLPIPAIFPIKIQGCGFLFISHYLCNVFNTASLLCLSIDTEVSFGYYSFQIAGILRKMGYQLENPEPNESRILLLRSCARKHNMLLHCRDMIEDIYGPIIAFLVLTNAIAMCSLIFQAFQTKITFGKYFMIGAYFFMKLTQTALYTWCATVIATESERFSNGVYFNDWTSKSIAMKNDMIITMIQKPVIITAMGVFTLSMNLIPKIMNTTLSYYFLLKTLDEDN